jgi:serine/threonine-protein kinase
MTAGSLVGRRVAGFAVEAELGAGGMGQVVLARQESLDRPAVLKRIHPQLGTDEELEARFTREAMAAARLHHPNVVSVYDLFRYRGAQYIATEYVDGIDLAGILASERRLPWRIAATIALGLARGLEAIHATGTLHRDVKPQNVLIGRRGEVKITDFGLALDPSGEALTRPGIAVGTPPYMAPEQLRGERVDPRADLFALGCVVYEMLVGHPPYRSPSEEENGSLLARVESGRYPRLRAGTRGIPRRLARVVRRCLKPKAPRRMASAAELRRELEAVLGRVAASDGAERLAAFLWERHVFEPNENETVVRVAVGHTPDWRARVRVGVAAAALVVAALGLALSLNDPVAAAQWMDRVRSAPRELARERLGAVVESQPASVVARLGGLDVIPVSDQADAN